jgi:predicted nucleic acid-binding protein
MGLLTLDLAREQLDLFSRIGVEVAWLSTLSTRALELTLELGWTLPYDAFYLALALLLDCDVWTADRRFYRDARTSYSRVRFLLDYPRPGS